MTVTVVRSRVTASSITAPEGRTRRVPHHPAFDTLCHTALLRTGAKINRTVGAGSSDRPGKHTQ
jgi:hypothetical protein